MIDTLPHKQTAEQESIPRSQIDQDLHDLDELVQSGELSQEERFLFIRDMLRGFKQRRPDGLKKHISELSGVDGWGNQKQSYYDETELPVDLGTRAEFVLPNTDTSLYGDMRPYDSLRELPAFQQEFDTTDEHIIMEVRQFFMDRIPKSENPILHLGMSECSAIIAHTDSDVYVAHLDFSRKSQAEAVMAYLAQSGVDTKDIRIIGNTAGDNNNFDGGHYTYVPAEKRLMSKADFLGLGIPEENFTGYDDLIIDGKIRPLAEVIVDKDGVFFDQSHGFNGDTDDDILWCKYQAA